MVALDLDGTLLNPQGRLSGETSKTMFEAINRGIHIVVATGRGLGALPLDITACPHLKYAITSNGAHIVTLDDRKTIYSSLIPFGAVEPLKDILTNPELMVEVFFDHTMFAEKRCLERLEDFGVKEERARQYILGTRRPTKDIWELVKCKQDRLENINLIFPGQDLRMQVWEALKKMENITVTSSMPYNVEIGGRETSKGTALLWLAQTLEIQREEIMACGDSENDISMLQAAGLGVAMGNAVEAVKTCADFITGTNAKDGVAYAIRKFCL